MSGLTIKGWRGWFCCLGAAENSYQYKIDMMDCFIKVFRFVSQSHRGLHLVCGLLVGLVFGFGAALVAAGALEFKDCQHDRLNVRLGMKVKRWTWRSWDWRDFGFSAGGGVIGAVVRWIVVGDFL